MRSELAVPLEVMGEVRGVLNVDSDREDAFSQADQELLEALAVQAAKVIHNTWLFEQSRLKARLLETLVSVSQTINSTLNLNEALPIITREACTLMEAKMASIMMLDESGEFLELRASYGAGEAYLNKPKLSLDDSFLGIVFRRKKPMQLENVQSSALYQNVDMARREGLVSLLSAPLVFGGQAIGTLNIYTGAPAQFFQRGNPHLARPGGTVGHRHGKGPPLRAHRGCRGAVASKRKILRPRPARRGSRPRNPQSAHRDEDALPFAPPGFCAGRSAGEGRRHPAARKWST